MAAITKYAMTLPYFTEICGTTAYIKPETNLSEETTIGTTNRLLLNYEQNDGVNYYYQSCTGIKTGSLDESGYCITASATAYGYTYIVVAMGAPMYNGDGSTAYHTEMLDVRSLFRWAVTSLEMKTVATQGDILTSIDLEYAFQKDQLQLAAGENAKRHAAQQRRRQQHRGDRGRPRERGGPGGQRGGAGHRHPQLRRPGHRHRAPGGLRVRGQKRAPGRLGAGQVPAHTRPCSWSSWR